MRIIAILFGIALLVGAALGGSFLWDAFALIPDKDAREIVFMVEPGTSVESIARRLEDEDIVTSRFFFKAYVKLAGAQALLQAGEFALKPGMSFRTVVNELSNAKSKEVQVTIPEGFTNEQVGVVMRTSLPNVSEQDWHTLMADPSLLTSSVKVLSGIPAKQGLEGYLFPDTYRFRADTDAKTVASTMALTLLRRLSENEIVVPDHLVMSNGMTFHEVITLASMVEREVRSPEDMARVAGIFLTRLKIGMALQADSTVNYITGKRDAAVSYEDSRVPSLYNTYIHLGLPPGPISNPGMNAIRAVLNPVDSDFLYFLTTSEGEVVYAKSFDEHVANKYRYLK